jgi:hypothetical protein
MTNDERIPKSEIREAGRSPSDESPGRGQTNQDKFICIRLPAFACHSLIPAMPF